jgi:transcriptional regulator with XRE-family HTH domain
VRTELRYGRRVKEERLARGWTQEHLAGVAGITARTVARIEKDEVQGAESLMAVAAALEVDLKKLALVIRIGEVKPTRSLLVRQAEDLQIAFNRAHHSGLYRTLLLPVRDDWRERAEDFLEAIFADLQYLSPEETEIMRCWVAAAREPLAELRSMGMEIFTLQDNREIFIGEAGQRKLIENWTSGYYLLVLEHSCYLVAGKVHRFLDGCVEGVGALLRWLRQEQDGTEVQMGLFANPLVAFAGQPEPAFCKTCFPAGPTTPFITQEYLSRITGLQPNEFQALWEQFEKEIGGFK